MITLRQILDLFQYTDESLFLCDKNDNKLLGVRLYCDREFEKYYKYRVISLESTHLFAFKVCIDI